MLLRGRFACLRLSARWKAAKREEPSVGGFLSPGLRLISLGWNSWLTGNIGHNEPSNGLLQMMHIHTGWLFSTVSFQMRILGWNSWKFDWWGTLDRCSYKRRQECRTKWVGGRPQTVCAWILYRCHMRFLCVRIFRFHVGDKALYWDPSRIMRQINICMST